MPYHQILLITGAIVILAGWIALAKEVRYHIEHDDQLFGHSNYLFYIWYPLLALFILVVPPCQLYFLIWPYRLSKLYREDPRNPSLFELQQVHVQDGFDAVLDGEYSKDAKSEFIRSLSPAYKDLCKKYIRLHLDGTKSTQYLEDFVSRINSREFLQQVFMEKDFVNTSSGEFSSGQMIVLNRLKELGINETDQFIVEILKEAFPDFAPPNYEKIQKLFVLKDLKSWAKEMEAQYGEDIGMVSFVEELIARRKSS